ncbi:MAG: BofC C-terminal domain-containing protein [Bacillota bacterium]
MLRKCVLGALGLLLGFALSYSLYMNNYFHPLKYGARLPVDPPNAEVTQTDLKIKITPQTEITQKIKYTKCGEEEVTKITAGEKLVGLTFQQMQQLYPGWTIETFDARDVVLKLVVDDYCKTHSEHMFLGVHNDHVAIFAGKPGPGALLKEETNILLQSVQPQDRLELEKGIVVKDRSELLQTLEGLQEHR